MKVSDELREFAYLHFSGIENIGPCDALMSIADCIEAEMVELPRDRDGVPIHVGDTVYGDEEDRPEVVTCVGIVSTCHGWRVWAPVARCPNELTHIPPDSLERIADELEEWTAVLADCDVDAAHEFAVRIRKLTEKESTR